MIGRNKSVEHFWVSFEVLVESLVLLCPLNVELTVDLSRKAWHEWLLERSKEI